MKIQKKHILVSALVLALGAAVYLNWHFSDTPLVLPTSKELGAATYVSKDTKATADEPQTTSKTALTPRDQLAKSRTERSQAQDKALDSAKNILTLSDSSDEAKEEAVEQAGEIQKRILAQSNIENILAAKGYPDCLCYISDGGCTVTVLGEQMQKDSPLIIKDVVMSQLDIDFNDIVIIDV
jgi:stage III sporulation protein AH